ncbi:MAG: FMN-binding negative transcriptional regulator [Acidimicrobiia bacterium]|nr:FMN-binding negative transcriptional regulator [Acidimicrobiia bacterium]
MLIRSVDDATDDEPRWRRFVEQQGFGHFVAPGRDRAVPAVVPTQFLLDGRRLFFHLARPNPVFEALDERADCLMSVAGDWAYIPGSWKAIDEEDPRHGIPTTYYAAVQLIGRAEVVDEPPAIAAILRRQLARQEPDGDYVDPIEHGSTLRGIRGIVVDVASVRAKFKYGGNVDQAHRHEVARRLDARGGPGDHAALRHLTDDESTSQA